MTEIDDRIDMLRAGIEAEEDALRRADLYDELSYHLQMSDPAASFAASAAGLRLAIAAADMERAIRSFIRISDYFRHIGKYASAHRWLTKAWRAMEDIDGMHFRKASMLRRQAALHHAWGDSISAIDALERALAICRRPDAPPDNTGHAAATLGYMAEIYTEIGDHVRALELFSEALTTFDLHRNDRAVGKTLYNIGCIHQILGDRGEAIKVFQESIERSRVAGSRFAEANSLIQIGNIRRSEGEVEAAITCYGNAIAIDVEIENRFGEAMARSELAKALRLRGERESAMASMAEALAIFDEIGNRGGAVTALQGIGELRLADGLHAEAIEAFEQARDQAAEIGHRKEQSDLELLLAGSFEQIGNHARALAHFKAHTALKEILAGESTRRSAEAQRMRAEIQRSEMERHILQLKAEKLEQEMERKVGELTSMALRLAHSGEFLQKLRDRIARFSHEERGADGRDFANVLLGEIRANMQQDSDWETFEHQFQHVHHGFFQRLSERHPNLTPTELKVCSLLKINLSSKEIGNILNISARTVDNHRLSIRRKLALPSDANLTTLLSAW